MRVRWGETSFGVKCHMSQVTSHKSHITHHIHHIPYRTCSSLLVIPVTLAPTPAPRSTSDAAFTMPVIAAEVVSSLAL